VTLQLALTLLSLVCSLAVVVLCALMLWRRRQDPCLYHGPFDVTHAGNDEIDPRHTILALVCRRCGHRKMLDLLNGESDEQ
jgi:phage-related protein